ncbi:MAG: hypothetical protein EKK55_01830 [Rhodocyclaceae bacterium]|nr:MAG: hypothetical protein EKK55_01830 [Rhodocyclaceae bacterium]
MSSPAAPTMMAVDPRTGAHLRVATPAEVAAWLAQPARHPAFRDTVRVGDVLVYEYTGPGIWFGGAGF